MNYRKPLTYFLAGYLGIIPLAASAQEVARSKLVPEQTIENVLLASVPANEDGLLAAVSAKTPVKKPILRPETVYSQPAPKKEKTFWQKNRWYIIGAAVIATGVTTYLLTKKKDKPPKTDIPPATTPTTPTTPPPSGDPDNPRQ